MDDLGKCIKQVSRELQDYIETKIELTVLNVSDRITYWIGKSVQQLFGYAIFGLGLVFGLTALAIYIGEVIGDEWAGYAIVSSPFILVGLILIVIKPKSMVRRIQDQILADLLNSFEENGDELKELPSTENSKKEVN
ncbi:hypothetical protein [Gracilimonas sp.]|uniref:hypothetical protein n=1 Tax=Gracilimonas sp. TaxID=1974203 RepID=UPI002871D5B8|nr:phage holin family protein [Gracilimonas sp.]